MSTPPRAYGTDRAEPGPNGSRILRSSVSRGWVPRKSGTRTSVEAIAAPEGGMQYRLELWSSRHAIRVVLAYDDDAEAARQKEQRTRSSSLLYRRLSILFSPVLGHLPGPVQEKMEGDFGAPARAMTIASALPLFVVGGVAVLARQLSAFGAEASFPWWLTPPLPVAVYWCVESALRLFAAFLQGIPMGSLPGVLAYELWRGVFRRGEPAIAPPARETKWHPNDTFKMLEPLLSLLSLEEQELLERRFGFDSLKWGRRSAILVGVIAAANVVISLGMLAQGRDSVWDALWLVAGGYLVVEQVLRLRRIAQGYPAASALGGLVRPIARRLLAPVAPEIR
jgi:hypothetical protein